MKKIVSTTAIFIGGLVFATLPNANKEKPLSKKNVKVLKHQKDSKVSLKKLPKTYYAETSCGFTATTTQDWTPQQASEWRDKIEANYCKTPTYSGPDAGSLAGN